MDEFQIKLLLSFLVGGGYIAFTIWVSQKFGSKLGGIAIGLPSTTLVSLLFIAWTQNSKAAVSAASIVPVGIAVSCIFVATFVNFYKRGRAQAFAIALMVWLALNIPMALLNIRNIAASIAISAVLFAISLKLVSKFRHSKLKNSDFSPKRFIISAAFAGTIVATAVFVGKTLGPLWGGIATSFPAGVTSSTLLLTSSHGIEFSASVAKAIPYGAMTTAVFAIAFYFLVPEYGIALGTITAYLASLASAFIIYKATD